ncbi:lysylphosphatidylglycerol synthase transmembrane domain-containing protein [Herbaspirillum sp. ST 5-3]|uniref:lysylphosphatidylglycerol synthase transmembrane domain-containing protein n=1 Tax=Oxalobacteraceae TaxID=75682 RepID=UPI001FFEB73F|nr:lysylphosphatidylglycerol synthase transmembrane domain-containing protein [Herbaspirillum sp. ST 5-3]
MTVKKTIRLALGMLLAGLFVWLVFRQISLEEVKKAFKNANLFLVMAALGAFFVGYSCRIARWRLMLEQDNPRLRWSDCAGPLMASVAANNILPFRAGDLLRAFGFNQRLNISAATSVTTLFVERLLDLLMVATLLGAVVTCFGMDSSRFIGVGGVALLAGAAVILFVLLFPTFFVSPAMAMAKVMVRIAPNAGHKIFDQVNKAFAALQYMAGGATMAKLVLWSLLAWIAEGGVFWFAALALPAVLSPIAAWLALPVGTLATVIPSTPGYVGTFDFFTVSAMTALGNSVAAATGYALLVHALLWIPPTVVGGLYLLQHPIRPGDKSKEA